MPRILIDTSTGLQVRTQPTRRASSRAIAAGPIALWPITYPSDVEPLCLFSAWNFSWCIVYFVDFCGQCMKFQPSGLSRTTRGILNLCSQGLKTTCARNPFISTFWTWFPLAVRLQSFLSTRERAILSRTNSVICLDSTEVLLALTEQRENISVDCWEVPTPRVAAWSSPEEVQN